jgi:hypothetical protein
MIVILFNFHVGVTRCMRCAVLQMGKKTMAKFRLPDSTSTDVGQVATFEPFHPYLHEPKTVLQLTVDVTVNVNNLYRSCCLDLHDRNSS